MTADLLVIVPSRGRPQNVARLAAAPGWDGADLLVGVDDDDPCLKEYLSLDVDVTVGPRLGMGGTLNHLAVIASTAYAACSFLGDDHVPRTPGWARQIIEILDGMGTGIVYGNDLMQGPMLPTAVFMTSDIIRSLGYMVPPGLAHLFVDNAWKSMGERLGCLRYLNHVVIEHCHPQAGKSEWDAGYVEVNSGAMWAHDEAVYKAWLAGPFETDMQRVLREVAA